MKKRDSLTLDMFEELPPTPISSAGGLSCRAEIAHAMSDALTGLDRYTIAAKMSRLLGREVSKSILDKYTAESSEYHIPPLDTAIAFDLATESRALAILFATKIGAKLSVGVEALDAEIGKLERQREENAKRIRELKRAIGEQV